MTLCEGRRNVLCEVWRRRTSPRSTRRSTPFLLGHFNPKITQANHISPSSAYNSSLLESSNPAAGIRKLAKRAAHRRRQLRLPPRHSFVIAR
ncbi:unnamed protein product [Toxocara canis]|uniref:Uncharacterized protein n=1 Tax=Toxocara canis TaxID=6265 RepID=A0A3P7H9C7_TOXCA|nr:unnamed protein product [Toxocara canis]